MHGSLLPAGEIDDFIVFRARLFASQVRRAMVAEVLKDENLSVLEWRLMFSIARFGSCHVAHITQHTSIDAAHGSRAAAALEKRGLITRTPDPRNRRRKLASLTAEGQEIVLRLWPKARGVVRKHTDLLKAEELEDLKRLLDLLNGVATPEESARNGAGLTNEAPRSELRL